VTVLIVSLLTLVDAHTWLLKKLGVSDHDSNGTPPLCASCGMAPLRDAESCVIALQR
jgi:hypothetical protein